MADVVETTKVEEETTVKEVTKEVPLAEEAVVTSDEKAEVPLADEAKKEGENGSATEELNGGTNGNGTNGVETAETTEETLGNDLPAEETRKRKSEGVEVPLADATDGVSAEKKAKLEEKSDAKAEDGIETPENNGAAEVTA